MRSVSFNQQEVIPSKIICVGRNYLNHIKELNNAIPAEPVLFIKPNSAITSQLTVPNNKILHYEAELCLLIQNKKIAGVGVGLDLTNRILQSELQQKGLPWEKAKAFDGSAMFSVFIWLPIKSDLAGLSFVLRINGELKQQGIYKEMIHKPSALLSYIQTYFSLDDNDIIMTGTPEGVGEIKKSDLFTLELYLKGEVLLQKSCEVV